MGAAASAGVEAAAGPTPDCYFCHTCRHSFEFMPGPQADGREVRAARPGSARPLLPERAGCVPQSEAPDICTACGGDIIEMVRRGGRSGSMMPATDTLHQLVMASDGAISGPELLLNMLAFSGNGPFADVPGEAEQESFDASTSKLRPTPPEVAAALPERPLGISVLAREPECVICGEDFVLGKPATALPCAHHFVSRPARSPRPRRHRPSPLTCACCRCAVAAP